MLQEAIQPTAHLQLSCPRPLISLYVSIWAFPLDLWYPRPRFRAWGQGAGREAGSWEQDAVRNATGSAIFSLDGETTGIEITRGYNVFFSGNTGPIRHISTVGTTTQGVNILSFALSGAVPTGPVTVPPHVWQPIMLYLGVPA